MPKLSCSVKPLVFKTLCQSPRYSVLPASKPIVDRDKDVLKTLVSNLSGVSGDVGGSLLEKRLPLSQIQCIEGRSSPVVYRGVPHVV